MRGDYAGRARPEREERRRLRHLAESLNPGTQRRMSALGISQGWKCLEIGAAEGSMSTWMAEQVGPSGRVVAADIDLRFLDGCRASNLEVCELDLRSDELESDHYDLAYCRTLLLHLPDPLAALHRLVSALRPGGWLLVQEPDAGPTAAANLDHPHAETFSRVTHQSYRWLRARGVFDSYFGRRLPALIASLDLDATGSEGIASYVRGASEGTEIYKQTLSAMQPMLTRKGVVTEAEIQQVLALYDDPDFDLVGEIQFAAWGRKRAS